MERENQKAIKCLKELKGHIFVDFLGQQPLLGICNLIDNKIKELEEGK